MLDLHGQSMGKNLPGPELLWLLRNALRHQQIATPLFDCVYLLYWAEDHPGQSLEVPKPDWRDVFCGRDVELKQLISAYDAVADGSGPRLAVVTAERGMGKTRLVQELYRILSTERDPADYWPDASLFKGNNLLVAPDFNEALTKAHFASFKTSERPMPFLWWGFRLNDLLGRNAWGSDMAGHRRTLDPHLARALFARMDAASREKLRGSAFNTITGAALAIAEALLDGVPGVGPFKSFVEFARGIRKAKKERDKLHDQACTFAQADITALEAKRTQEIYERTLEELALVLEPTAPLEKLPTVVFCDDAQFARDGGDEGALRFLDKLWQRAEKGKWPLLLVATHWESNWGLDRLGENASFAKTFGSVADDANKSTIIRLSQQSDLGVLIDRGLPGLPAKDVAYLLHQSDGNPQMLIELVGLINTRETYRAHGALTPHAYGNIEKLSENLTTMITDRLNSDATPDDVKVAIALSSLQGMQFLSSLTDETAEVLQGVEFCSSLTETAAKALKLGAASSGLNK
ncbi:AAA family ATPase, partial [Candidatus Accumulibacter phosphatis]